jgi:predicted Zn-dependent protease
MSRIALAVVLMLAISLVGCGNEKNKTTNEQEIAAQTTPKEPTVTPVATPPEPVVVEPEVVPEPEPPRQVTYGEAESAYNARNYTEAMELFSLYTDQNEQNPWGHYMLGLSAWKSGQLDQAERAFGQALEIDPLHVKSWVNLTRVLLDGDRPEDALTSINEALALDPESNVTLRLKGRVYDELGRIEEAVEAYRMAIGADPQDAWSMNNLALMLIEDLRFDEALPVLALAIEERDDVPTFYNNLGMALENTGHFRAAQSAYESALAIDSTYARAETNRDRVELVEEDPMLEPVDLAALAQGFRQEVAGWHSAAVHGDQTETATESDTTSTTGEEGETTSSVVEDFDMGTLPLIDPHDD